MKPNDELIASVLGEKELLWNQTVSYLYDHHKDISIDWKYSNCGKEWFCQGLKKSRKLFWIKMLQDTFRIAFWFGDKQEPAILQSELPEAIKNDFLNAKRFNKARCIYVDMYDSKDFENVKKLMELKIISL